MDHDCGFDQDGRWFRYRAGAIILNADSVLRSHNDVEPYFYSIGGGVHHMETAEAAVRRYPSFFATELAEIGSQPKWITTRG